MAWFWGKKQKQEGDEFEQNVAELASLTDEELQRQHRAARAEICKMGLRPESLPGMMPGDAAQGSAFGLASQRPAGWPGQGAGASDESVRLLTEIRDLLREIRDKGYKATWG